MSQPGLPPPVDRSTKVPGQVPAQTPPTLPKKQTSNPFVTSSQVPPPVDRSAKILPGQSHSVPASPQVPPHHTHLPHAYSVSAPPLPPHQANSSSSAPLPHSPPLPARESSGPSPPIVPDVPPPVYNNFPVTLPDITACIINQGKQIGTFPNSTVTLALVGNKMLSLSINSTCIAILNPSVPTFSPFPGQFFFREQPGDNHVEGAEKRYILIRVNSPDHVAILTSALYYNSSFCEIKSEEIREMIGSLAPETSSTHGAAASYMKTGGEFVGGAFRLIGSGIGAGIKLAGKGYESIASSGNSGEVSDKTKQDMERAKNVAAATARGTGFVLGKVAAGMQWIGKTAMEHGNSKQPEKVETPQEREKRLKDNALKEGALAGASAAWQGLMEGANTVGNDFKHTTVHAVQHTHGESYANATTEGFGIATDGATAALRIVTLPKLWVECGINMAVGALTSKPAQAVIQGGEWKQGFLSIHDSRLGWSTKWVVCTSRGLVFYSKEHNPQNKSDKHKVTGIIPFIEVNLAYAKEESVNAPIPVQRALPPPPTPPKAAAPALPPGTSLSDAIKNPEAAIASAAVASVSTAITTQVSSAVSNAITPVSPTLEAKRPGCFYVATHRISTFKISLYCPEFPASAQIDFPTEVLDWIECINNLSAVQQILPQRKY